MFEVKKIIRGSVVLTVGRVTSYALSFARNLILARALTKADYGLAAVFSLAMMLLEIAGRMAFGQQIIQSKQGDTASFMNSAHTLQFLGGLCGSVLILGMSVPMSHLFKVPHAWWAFACLAVVPFCQGLSHLDIARRQRNLEYIPLILVDVVPQFISVAFAWPLALWYGDYKAIIVLMVGKAALSSALSFWFARYPYRWGWQQEHVRNMLLFGYPLLLNSIVMFACQQGDQVIIGGAFDLNSLANYSLAFLLVGIPWYIFSQVASSLMLPLLSRAQDNFERFRYQYRICVEMAAVSAVVLIVPLIVAGEHIITLLYGKKYEGTGVFVAFLGAASALRFLRFAPALASLARADTLNQLYSKVWRSVRVPLALFGVFMQFGIIFVAACSVLGELIAAYISIAQLRRHQRIPLMDTFGASLYISGFVLIGLGSVYGGAAHWNLWAVVLMVSVAIALSLYVAWVRFSTFAAIVIPVLRFK